MKWNGDIDGVPNDHVGVRIKENKKKKFREALSFITFKDFEKPDIRVGTITAVSEVEKSNKLMKLTVDFGDHERSILAGIKKERENPAEIEGKQALFVVNLPEQKMAGEISQGMLFDIGYADKLKPCLAMPEVPMPNGSRAG